MIIKDLYISMRFFTIRLVKICIVIIDSKYMSKFSLHMFKKIYIWNIVFNRKIYILYATVSCRLH